MCCTARPSVYGFTTVVVLLVGASITGAQTVTLTRSVNLRPEQSKAYPPIRLLTLSEPPLALLEPYPLDGYYRVKTQAGEDGYVWSRSVRVSVTPVDEVPLVPPGVPAATITLASGVPGGPSMKGCGDNLWNHVYHPTRLIVRNDCVTVTGTIVDATADQSHHQKDGVRHEGDGDTHGWLKVDPQFANLINDGNTSNEDGNLVFEFVCHYTVKQDDAKSACRGFTDHTTIAKVGSHVAIRGTLVTEKNHGKWNEVHPVTSIKEQ
jgi:hypothetical protein